MADLVDPAPAAEALARAGLLVHEYADDAWLVSFEHPMLRAALLDDVGPVDRRTLHQRAAQALPPGEGLLHRVAAATGPDPDLVDDLLGHATERRSAGEPHVAATLLLKATALMHDGPQREHTLHEAAALFLLVGDMSGARAVSDRLRDLPRTPQRLFLEARIAWFSGDPTTAETLADEAWEHDGSEPGRGACAAILAQLHNLRGEGAEAAEWADHALAEELPPDLVDTTRAARAAGLAIAGRVRDALSSLDDLPEDPRACDAGQEHRLLARAALRGASDDLVGARADLDALVASSAEVAPQRLLAMGVLAETDFRLGRWDDAISQAEHALSLAEASEQVWVQGFLHTEVARVAAGRGDWAVAERHLGSARELAESLEDVTTYAVCDDAGVLLASCQDDPAQVLSSAQTLAFFAVPALREPGWLSWPVHYLSALVEVGRVDEAEELLPSFEDVAHDRGSRSRLAALARIRGELATARRQHTEARARLEEALAVGDGTVDALEHGLALLSHGRFLRRRGERRAAADSLSAARTHFLSLGARPFVERCDHELAASGLPVEPVRTDVTAALTPQERLVAGLACKGMSNKEISHHLVLSVKTIGFHLGNVYAKLDVHSRSQLVARFRDL